MRWPGGVACVVEENDYSILVWKPEGKRAPRVYQLVCHIVWRRTEFRLVPLRLALALQRRPRCIFRTCAAGLGAPRGRGCF